MTSRTPRAAPRPIRGLSWPDPVWQVPCDQPHADEVFYANASFWPADDSYPGGEVIILQGLSQCVRQFWQYVGMLPGGSRYEYTYIAPDSYAWQYGDRGLVCVAYDPTSVLSTSIKGSDQ